MIYIGIDPGKSGAIAAIRDDGEIVDVWRTPVITVKKGKNAKDEYNPVAMTNILRTICAKANDCVVVLEHVNAMPGQGVTSMFSMGKGVGMWQGIIAALGIPLVEVTPQTWKKAVIGVKTGDNKQASILRCIQLMPRSEPLITSSVRGGKRYYHDGCAEALLIAKWLMTQSLSGTPSKSAAATHRMPTKA